VNLVIKEEGPHMYQLIDYACDIAYRKIHEQKERTLEERKASRKDKF
jgi:hypothetical protein